jgi:hypothetical protein
MRLNCLFAAAGLFALFPTTILAAEGPAQLRSKSIVVSWTEERVQRHQGEGNFKTRQIPQTLTIYVSSKGNLFARRTATGGGRRAGTGSRDTVGRQATTSTGGPRVLKFSGHTLSAIGGVDLGARSVSMKFDNGFSSCAANVVIGRQSGSATMRVTSLVTGETIEIKSAKAHGISCSVRDGNAFGN